MSSPPDNSPLEAFLEQYWKDRSGDSVRSIREYLDRFPGNDELIAAEFTHLEEERKEPSTDPDDDSFIGPYRTISELGRGGQGIVYLAEDTRLNRHVALKVLSNLGPGSEDLLHRFHREAEVASRLEHPGICGVHDAGTAHGVDYIAMRYVEGETLARTIAAAKENPTSDDTPTLAVSDFGGADGDPSSGSQGSSASGPGRREQLMDVVTLIEKAARALHAAHEAGIVHRDIKPGNIMLAKDGGPVILDFGLAREDTGDVPSLTRSGDLFGTPSYMSPEQLMAQRITLDRRTDVWSLAVTLYECLTLHRPFEGPSRQALYQAIMTKEPPDPRRINHHIPPELKVVLETALEKDRDRRYQTAEDFAEELRRVRSYEPIHAKAIGPGLRVRRWAQRHPAMATAVISVFILLVGGLGITMYFLGETQSALEREETARKEADEQREIARESDEETTALLAKYEQALKPFQLEELVNEARDLWPAVPANAAAMKAWLERARTFANLLPKVQLKLDELRANALPLSEEARQKDRAAHEKERREIEDLDVQIDRIQEELELAATDSELRSKLGSELTELKARRSQLEKDSKKRLTYEFTDPLDGRHHGRLVAFLEDLRALTVDTAHGETIAAMEARYAFATSIEQRSVVDHAQPWREAIEAIAIRYMGLPLEPQLGLVPLGPDPESGLWEFAHLETGTVPRRDPDTGRLLLTEESGLVFVLIPNGRVKVGAQKNDPKGTNYYAEDPHPTEGPVHEVTLRAYFLSKYEMTQGQWARATGTNPSGHLPGRPVAGQATPTLLHPVEQVDWNECDTVLRRLGLVLPTEAQWEYACRAGTGTPWWTGAEPTSLREAANLADQAASNGGQKWSAIWLELDDGFVVHAPVGSYRANGFGLHDMYGNVWEWCQDWFAVYEHEARTGDGLRGQVVFKGYRRRMQRGGAYNNAPSEGRSSYRGAMEPTSRDYSLGVRPARAVTR